MRTWCPKPPTAPSALQLSELFYSPSSPARPPCPSRVQDTLLPRSFCAAPPAWKAYSAGHGLGFLWTPCRFWLTGHLCNKAFLTTNIKTQALKKKIKTNKQRKKNPQAFPATPSPFPALLYGTMLTLDMLCILLVCLVSCLCSPLDYKLHGVKDSVLFSAQSPQRVPGV